MKRTKVVEDFIARVCGAYVSVAIVDVEMDLGRMTFHVAVSNA